MSFHKFPILIGALFLLPGCTSNTSNSNVATTQSAAPNTMSSAVQNAAPSAADMMQTIKNASAKIKVQSAAFGEGKPLALQQAHSDCGGGNVSPPLSWQGVPPTAKSVAIVVNDPDAPGGAWTHWIIYNLPPGRKNIGAGIAAGETVPGGASQIKNDWNVAGYGGPCPPSGTHHYQFYVLALDRNLALPSADKSEFAKAISGHILARGALAGTYSKAK